METILSLAIALIAGIAMGRIAKFIRLPDVTGYLMAGLILGPSIGGVFDREFLEGALALVTSVALGFIAFQIGSQFKLTYMKKIGAGGVIIAIFESFLAAVIIFGGLFIVSLAGLIEYNFGIFLMLAAIGSATAPGVTIMVVNQYKARGSVTDTMMSVVAIDDATGLIIFGIAGAIAAAGGGNIAMEILEPIVKIIAAIALGFLVGAVFTASLKWFKSDGNRLILICAAILSGSGLAELLGLSDLLLLMALGAMFANLYKYSSDIIRVSDTITPPIFVIFYVLCGADLDLSLLPAVGVIGVAYILFRTVGKLFGTNIGCRVAKSPPEVKKYLGLTLLPQAGVAIGLAGVAAVMIGGEAGLSIKVIIIVSTLIYELAGPLVTKVALVRSGDIQIPEEEMSKKQRQKHQAAVLAAREKYMASEVAEPQNAATPQTVAAQTSVAAGQAVAPQAVSPQTATGTQAGQAVGAVVSKTGAPVGGQPQKPVAAPDSKPDDITTPK
jgi:Kef-type K+ transport system membrane component KefB